MRRLLAVLTSTLIICVSILSAQQNQTITGARRRSSGPTITFVRVPGGVTGGGGGASTTYTTGDNVWVMCQDHFGATYTVDDNISVGNVYTSTGAVVVDPAHGISAQAFRSFNVTGGTGTTTCHVSGGSNNFGVLILEWHSTAAASLDQHCSNGANSGTTPTSGTCTTTQANEFLAGGYWDAYGDSGLVTNPGGSGFTWSTGSGCGVAGNCPQSTFYSNQSGWKITSAIGGYAFTVNTGSSGHSVMILDTFK